MKNTGVLMACLLLALWCGAQSPSSQNIFDQPHSEAFARYLMISRQYDLAALEYERLVYLSPNADSVKYELLLAYRLSGQASKGLGRYRQLYPGYSGPGFVLKEACKSSIAAPDMVGLRLLLDQPNQLAAMERERYQIGWLFLNGQRRESHQMATNSTFFKDSKYTELTATSLVLKRKSPWLAAGLSAVVPGLGKVYTGRWRDGVFAAIMVGTIGWRSYRLLDKKGPESVFGWVFGAASAGFYVSNIWGSYRSAKLYNYNKIHEKEQRMVDYLLND